MSFTDPKGAIGGGRWMPWKNAGGTLIPAWALVQITGTQVKDGVLYWECETPGADADVANVVFNGPAEVAASGFGVCTYDAPSRVLYEYPPDVAVGDTVGPKDGQYTISKDGSGFEVLGDIDTANKWCHVGKSGGGSGTITIQFEIASGSGAFVTATVLRRPPGGGALPGVTSGSLTVWDRNKPKFFGEPAALLVGRRGTAAWMKFGEENPEWICVGLDCPDSTYDTDVDDYA